MEMGSQNVYKVTFFAGIVFPRQIFQQRKYQTIIRNSLSEIAQEKCHHGDDHQVSEKRGTRNGIRFR